MRILLIGAAYPLRGGIAQYSALLYQKLTEKGHTVDVLTFKLQYPNFLFPGKTQLETDKPLIEHLSFVRLNSINPLNWITTAFWIRKQRPDLLVFNYWMPFFAPCYATLAWFSKKRAMKSLAICHNIIPHEKKPGDLLLSKLFVRTMDSFIVHSKSIGEDLVKLKHDARFKEIHHPLYESFPPGIPKKQAKSELKIKASKVIAYFGLIRAYKGLKYLVLAMPIVLKELDVHLLIAGEFYEGKDEILNIIEQNGLENHITLIDRFIPNQEVPFYFCAADVMVLPYVTATQSGIIQMAYHYNKPVIATEVGGLPEVVPDNRTGFIVPPKKSDALAKAILRFYQEDKEAEFSANIEEEKKKYDWHYIVNAIETLSQ